uniref:Ig-like domain-containing protein n=1 Tax=Dicentrarchus labrax TaxID=13489 RepID=A0A8C4NI53_DICLA
SGQRLTVVTFTALHTGLIDGSDVTQNETLWKYKGDRAILDCRHTKDANYRQMYWYRQLPGETMKLIDDVKGKISFDGNGQKYSNLNISSLSLNDSGVYFCAASRHSASDSPQVNTKTLLYLPADRQHVESLNTCSQPPSKPSFSRF